MENNIYENALNNSIGKEKRVKKIFNKKNLIKIPAAITLAAIIAVSATGCSLFTNDTTSKQQNDIYEQYNNITDDYGVTTIEINNYERQRLYDLLDKYGIDNYEYEGAFRIYHLTAEDYAKIKELDETYLCTLYHISSKEAANELAKALGYESLDDYLIKNNYVTQDGKADYRLWSAANSVYMAQQLSTEKNNENSEGGKVK